MLPVVNARSSLQKPRPTSATLFHLHRLEWQKRVQKHKRCETSTPELDEQAFHVLEVFKLHLGANAAGGAPNNTANRRDLTVWERPYARRKIASLLERISRVENTCCRPPLCTSTEVILYSVNVQYISLRENMKARAEFASRVLTNYVLTIHVVIRKNVTYANICGHILRLYYWLFSNPYKFTESATRKIVCKHFQN